MKKLVRRFKCWNHWRKCSMNHPVSKFLVLIGIIKSPTFEIALAWHNWYGEFDEILKEGFKNG